MTPESWAGDSGVVRLIGSADDSAAIHSRPAPYAVGSGIEIGPVRRRGLRRRGRHGRGLSRPRHRAGPRRRHQGPAPGSSLRRRCAAPPDPGSAHRLGAQPSAHRDRVRRRRRRRRPLHRDGVRRRPAAERADRRGPRSRRGAAHRHRRQRRAGAGPRRRHRPPRSQAGQRRRLRRRRAQGPRLRDRQAGRPAGRGDAARRDHHRAHRHGAALADQRLRRHARLRGARAGDRRQGGRAQRHLQLRLDALRDADRTARLPRRHRGRDDRRGARTPADAAARNRPGPAGRARAGRAALPAQGARAPVPVDRRCPGRAPGHRRRADQGAACRRARPRSPAVALARGRPRRRSGDRGGVRALVAESQRRAAPRPAARAVDHGVGDRVVGDVLAGRTAVRVRLGRRDPAAGRQLELRSVGTAGGRHRGAPDHRRSGRRAGTELVAGRALDRLPARTRRRDPAGPRRLPAGWYVATARRDPGGADRDQLAARRASVADHVDAGQPPRRVRPRRRTAGRHQRHRDRGTRRRRAARPDRAGGAPGAPRPGVLAGRDSSSPTPSAPARSTRPATSTSSTSMPASFRGRRRGG